MASSTGVKQPPYVILVWDDAWGDATTIVRQNEVESRHLPTVMQTMGWLLRSDDTGVFLANERCLDAGDEGYRGCTFVPRALVRSCTPFNIAKVRTKKAQEVPTT